ncbi:MAG: hypothetical protein ACE5JD_00690 [Candidatus Methylomirabilia bacterium]
MGNAPVWDVLARRSLAAALAFSLLAAGCARTTLVLPVRIEPETLSAPAAIDSLADYESVVRSIAAVMVAELGVPLPRQFTVFVCQTRAAYERTLIREGRTPAARAAEIAQYSVGLGQHQRLFIDDEGLRGAPRTARLRIVAHELTHLAQYELSDGRRGSSEQWLREGMADWVAVRVLERLGEDMFFHQRDRALRTVARALPRLEDKALDLVDLGRPLGWEARHLRSGSQLTYQLAFLLTADLIRQRGFESLIAYFRAFAHFDDRFGHFRRAFGLPVSEFESRALRRIHDELQRKVPASAGEPLGGPDAAAGARKRHEPEGNAGQRD